MKFLKILLYIVVAIVLIVLILTFVAPTKMVVTRSVVINAPRDVVYRNVSTFENLNKWSPWNKMDPNMTHSIEGTDGTVGAKWKWQGEKMGTGEQTLSKIDPGKEVDTHLLFVKPMQGEADAVILLSDTADGTKVTWAYDQNMSRPMNIMGLFIAGSLGKTFDQGLGYLKDLSEKDAQMSKDKAYPGYRIVEMDMPERTFVGKRQTVSFKDMSAFFAGNLPKIMEDIQKGNVEMAGPPSGIFYTYDTVKMESDMAAVIPVKQAPTDVKGWDVIRSPAGKALVIDYYGAYEKVEPAYVAFGEYMKEKGMTDGSLVIEEYVTDPGMEKDTAKWLTKIYYYVK